LLGDALSGMLDLLELQYFSELPFAARRVERVLLRSPETWVLKLARQAGRRGELLLSEVGFGPPGRGLRKNVLIDVGRPYRLASKTVLPITWRATAPRRLFPEMEADVGVLALGAGRSQLSFNGRYRPPLGAVGRGIDRALLHRVAEATARDFVNRLARALESLLGGGSRIGQRGLVRKFV
jgi:hypothetical protein